MDREYAESYAADRKRQLEEIDRAFSDALKSLPLLDLQKGTLVELHERVVEATIRAMHAALYYEFLRSEPQDFAAWLSDVVRKGLPPNLTDT